jgi:(p)ppGpp synthase/HD superfamily hydrolase
MLSERFTQALIYATELHQNQQRKGSGVPYIAHLLAVSSIVLEYGGKEDEAIAALLHDAIEDQGGAKTRTEIERRFGENVTNIVNGCTDSDITPKPPWKERKEQYIAHISTVSPSVRLVSAADKLHNARSIIQDYHIIGEEIWQRFKAGKEGSLWYYRALVTAFQAVENNHLIKELDRVVTMMENIGKS